MLHMRRREFVTLIGGAAAAWPLAARAQQRAMPVVGVLLPTSLDTNAGRLRAFRQGLKDTGLVEGENVAIEYRSAEGHNDQLPTLAADLVRRQVAVIASPLGADSALAAKVATTTIPIVFGVGDDPVKLGLVTSLARPGGNLTGVNYFNYELVAKRLEFLRELMPAATRVAVLVNPANAAGAETTLRDVQAAGRAMGLQIQVLNASTSREIDAAFATFVRERPDALFVGGDPFFSSRRVQLVHLATLHKVPAIFSNRDYVEAGGLMSYGGNVADAWRQVGTYAGRILKGAKPADLPVVQASKFDLVINVESARPVRLIVGFPAGGSASDIVARLMGQWLSERLGQQFVVENRPGAATNLATEAVVRAPPDGYTLLFVTATNALNHTLYNNLNFNFIRDIAPVASIYRAPFVMLVNPSVPAKTLPEFIAYAKANPGKLNMASSGSGGGPHVFGELFKAMAGVDMVHVPYRGNPFPDLLSGQVQVFFSSIPPAIELIRTDKLRALAVTTATRQEVLPDIPTVGEFVPGYEASGWSGVGSPKSTPTEVIDKLNREINTALADPKIKAQLADLGAIVFANTPADFAKLITDDTEKWGKVIKSAGIKPE